MKTDVEKLAGKIAAQFRVREEHVRARMQEFPNVSMEQIVEAMEISTNATNPWAYFVSVLRNMNQPNSVDYYKARYERAQSSGAPTAFRRLVKTKLHGDLQKVWAEKQEEWA